jgi:hypothetical protein
MFQVMLKLLYYGEITKYEDIKTAFLATFTSTHYKIAKLYWNKVSTGSLRNRCL